MMLHTKFQGHRSFGSGEEDLLRFLPYTGMAAMLVMWLVGCFRLNGPLRQYFSLYRAVSQREGERKEK